MSKLSFRQKLWLPLVISLIALTLISVFNAYQAREIRIEERKNNSNNLRMLFGDECRDGASIHPF